jgi:D-methionine transport system substrate-binding protein
MISDKKEAWRNMMKRLSMFFCLLGLVLGLVALTGCRGGIDGDKLVFPGDGSLVRVEIGASVRPHSEILNYIIPALRADGIELIIHEIIDFHVPNVMLYDKQLHANYFQHEPFLNAYMTRTGNDLYIVGPVHVEPMGGYSQILANVMDIPEGGSVAIPHDATNGGRALFLLASTGLITLCPEVGILATPNDITSNPRNLRFIELEAAILPMALINNEADLLFVNTNHLIASNAGFCPVNDSLIREPVFGNPYANILVVREENADSEVIAMLYRHLTSEAVRAFILREYTGIEPVF